ncbi:flagellar export protein FliJ [Thiomicrorhabdus sediminis]|uniref:Flagellar FliJ protein n=1 Tax=Thiomicrorhabdus sediminis TaxID=2580412 RepID=A0A4P9K7L3_9GAMM|nr:flagellar export protein FliJ [Thiomicrorhabdus sediminis]QCU90450.1 flagellar export protein FliJ [Thiomicrorhabdus sediminis]
MPNRLQRLHKLIELAEMELDKAGQTFHYMQNKLATEQGQVNSLLDYQADYAQQPISMGAIPAIQLQSRSAFSDKLNHAIIAQQQQVEESEKMVEMAQSAWQEKRANLKALQALYSRIENAENARINRQEQKLMDELSAQKFYQNQLKDR